MNDTAILNELIRNLIHYVRIDPCGGAPNQTDLVETVGSLINRAQRERKEQQREAQPSVTGGQSEFYRYHTHMIEEKVKSRYHDGCVSHITVTEVESSIGGTRKYHAVYIYRNSPAAIDYWIDTRSYEIVADSSR